MLRYFTHLRIDVYFFFVFLLEHELTFDEMIQLSKYNEERFNSLVNHEYQSSNTFYPKPSCEIRKKNDVSLVVTKPVPKNKILIYSDELEKNMDTRLHVNSNPICNFCLPDAAIGEMMDKVLNCSYGLSSTLILLFSRRGNLKEQQLFFYLYFFFFFYYR